MREAREHEEKLRCGMLVFARDRLGVTREWSRPLSERKHSHTKARAWCSREMVALCVFKVLLTISCEFCSLTVRNRIFRLKYMPEIDFSLKNTLFEEIMP